MTESHVLFNEQFLAQLKSLIELHQKANLEARAQVAGLTVPNYLRSLLGWPLEQQGTRKDLAVAPKKRLPKTGR